MTKLTAWDVAGFGFPPRLMVNCRCCRARNRNNPATERSVGFSLAASITFLIAASASLSVFSASSNFLRRISNEARVIVRRAADNSRRWATVGAESTDPVTVTTDSPATNIGISSFSDRLAVMASQPRVPW